MKSNFPYKVGSEAVSTRVISSLFSIMDDREVILGHLLGPSDAFSFNSGFLQHGLDCYHEEDWDMVREMYTSYETQANNINKCVQIVTESV